MELKRQYTAYLKYYWILKFLSAKSNNTQRKKEGFERPHKA